MRTLIIVLALASSIANAQSVQEDYYTDAKGKKMSKVEALKELIVNDNKTPIWRCRLQIVSRKGTVKNR